MRKGFDGLSGVVTNDMSGKATDGSVYVFFNKMRDKVKMLVWDKDGFVIYSKRLERGRFEQIIHQELATNSYVISYSHLVMLMSGISLIGLRQKPRYLLTKQG